MTVLVMKEMDAAIAKQKRPNVTAAAKSVAKKIGLSPATIEREWRRYKNVK
jgi:hypothetical protein